MDEIEKLEHELERARVEIVFGLDGGELEHEPWENVSSYWYESVPEWASKDFDTRHSASSDYRTAVRYCMYGIPTAPEGWEFVKEYLHSGEAECWCMLDRAPQGNASDRADPSCPLCEGDGYIYLGDGWCEVVYRRIPLRCPDCGGTEFLGDDEDENSCERCIQEDRDHAGQRG